MNNRSYLASFGIFMAIFFLSFWYVSTSTADFGMGVDVNISSSEYFEVKEDWLQPEVSSSYSSECETTEDNQSLFVDQGVCDWSSIKYNTSGIDGEPKTFYYAAENQDGNISATIASYNSTGWLKETESFDLQDNTTRRNLTWGSEDVSEIEINLSLDDKNSNDQLPEVEQYELEVTEQEYESTEGLTSEDTQYLALFVFLISGLLVAVNFFSG